MEPEDKENDKIVEFRSPETSEPQARESDISDPKIRAAEDVQAVENDAAEPPQQTTEKSDVAKMPLWKRAAKIRRLTLLGMNGTEICHTLGITYSQYRHSVRWMTQKSFSSNAMAFNRYSVEVQSRLEQMHMDMMRAREEGDYRAVAAFTKLGFDAINGRLEMALKLGILDREAIKIQTTTVEVGFGDENQVPWFAKKALDAVAEQVQ